jgi:hypothetical protein
VSQSAGRIASRFGLFAVIKLAEVMPTRYSIFDSALYRNRDAEWLFPQEKATLHDLQTSTCESKML